MATRPILLRVKSAATTYERVWIVVASIPSGSVATYGQIARIAGLGRNARLVGYALHATPNDRQLPWHRVVNAQGKISFAQDDSRHARQRQRLEQEGVEFVAGRIDLSRFLWRPDIEDYPPEYWNGEVRS